MELKRILWEDMVHEVSIFERLMLLFLLADSSSSSVSRLLVHPKISNGFLFVGRNWRATQKSASSSAGVSSCAAPSSSPNVSDFDLFAFTASAAVQRQLLILEIISILFQFSSRQGKPSSLSLIFLFSTSLFLYEIYCTQQSLKT